MLSKLGLDKSEPLPQATTAKVVNSELLRDMKSRKATLDLGCALGANSTQGPPTRPKPCGAQERGLKSDLRNSALRSQDPDPLHHKAPMAPSLVQEQVLAPPPRTSGHPLFRSAPLGPIYIFSQSPPTQCTHVRPASQVVRRRGQHHRFLLR